MITLRTDQKINSDFNLPALKLAITLHVHVHVPVRKCFDTRESYYLLQLRGAVLLFFLTRFYSYFGTRSTCRSLVLHVPSWY